MYHKKGCEIMNLKQEEFCRKYVENGGNGTQAYLEVYECDEDSARTNASRLLTNDNVKAYIEELQEEARNRHRITIDKIANEYMKLAFFNPADVFNDNGTVKDITELDNNVTAAIKSIKIKEDFTFEDGEKVFDGYTKEITFADKRASLDSLGKFLGMFVEKYELENDIKINIE